MLMNRNFLKVHLQVQGQLIMCVNFNLIYTQ